MSNFGVDRHKLDHPILSQQIVFEDDTLYKIDINGNQVQLTNEDIRILYLYHN